jgi:hypothetical protein
MHPDTPADRLARLCTAVAACATRHPRAVLVACLLTAVASAGVAAWKLEYHTQRNDLLSADKACQKRWQKYLDAFGDDDDMVVVAEGSERAQMQAALDDVAAAVKNRPDLFDRVFHRADLRPLSDRALLYLPPEQIEAIRDRVSRMDPLLGDFAPFAWRKLSVQSLLGNARVALEKRAEGKELTAAEQDLIALLPAVASSAAATVRDEAAYRNVWAVSGERRDELTTPQYFFTPDGSLAMLTCRPKKAAQSFTPAKEANEAMRAILADAATRHPGVTLGLTGLPVLETDEMVMSDVDSTRASVLALVGVAVLYFVVYRGFRYPLLTVGTLILGTVWALGWATLTVGHLNILSATFAVMLIGLGDYGVLWVAQYDEQRKLGAGGEEALRHTAAHAGPSVVVAALGTSLAFFATMLADFKAVAELGWIAGCGVLFCAAACLTALPAALAVQAEPTPQPPPCREGESEPSCADSAREAQELCSPSLQGGGWGVGPSPATLPFPATFLPALAARPRLVLAVGALLLLACAAAAGGLRYDHNLLNLQARGTDSVNWEHKLISRSALATWDAMSIARSRDEALALKAKYEALPEVARVVEVASLVPDQQERKLSVVAEIHAKLAKLPAADKLPASSGSDPAAVRELAARVAQLGAADNALAAAATDLAKAVGESPAAAERLKTFDRRLVADLAAELRGLRDVTRPAPITAADIPIELRERFVGTNGEYLVRAFAKESLWDYAALQKFTAAAQAADAEATGKSFRTLEGLRQMKVGFEWAGVYALAAIILVLALDFRRMSGLLLGLFPLAVGVVLTLGVMALCGVALNPANMIALPLIVGVGVDNGVHVLHDYRSRDRRRAYRLGAATGRGVFVAGLTTVLGFGTMMIARHAGMASLGLVLAVGVTCCMAAALVVLPAVLHLSDRARLRRRTEVVTARVIPLEAVKAA